MGTALSTALGNSTVVADLGTAAAFVVGVVLTVYGARKVISFFRS